jgi:hypothetical protein
MRGERAQPGQWLEASAGMLKQKACFAAGGQGEDAHAEECGGGERQPVGCGEGHARRRLMKG